MTLLRITNKSIGIFLALCCTAYVSFTVLPNVLSPISPDEIFKLTTSGGELSNPYRNVALLSLALGLFVALLRFRPPRSWGAKVEYLLLGVIFTLNLAISAAFSPEFVIVQSGFLAVTIIFYVLLQRIWLCPLDVRRVALSGFSVSLYVILAWACLFGVSEQSRWIGALHPNHAGRFAVCAAFLSTLALQRVSILAVLISFLTVSLVSSRTGIVGLFAFVLVYVSLRSPRKLMWVLLGSVVATVTFAAADYSLFGAALTDKIVEGLHLNDASRGLSSGLSGRSDTYAHFWLRSTLEIIIGSGFRSEELRSITLHSGFFKNFYDWGIVGGIALYVCILAKAFGFAWQARVYASVEANACCSFIVASLLMTFSEPDSFMIGFMGSMVYLLALARPLHMASDVSVGA